jgi:rare lipoprotein A (peptidoglycan hydrolase)
MKKQRQPYEIYHLVSKRFLIAAFVALALFALYAAFEAARTTLDINALKEEVAQNGRLINVLGRQSAALVEKVSALERSLQILTTGSEIGLASWYGPGFHGRPTAGGAIFDKDAKTAAHRTLPLQAIVRILNLMNGKTAVLPITDRGPYNGEAPFWSGRIIDLSEGAARDLGMIEPGIVPVLVTHLAATLPSARPSTQD